jgi:hypothetical protein
LAERLCRKIDRINPARVRGPYCRAGRDALAPSPKILCHILQRSENAPIVGQRCAPLAPGPADRHQHVTCSPRWTASPLRPSLSFWYTHPSPRRSKLPLPLSRPRIRLGIPRVLSKRPAAAKLRSWRVSLLRQRARHLGGVEAPDEKAALAAAVRGDRIHGLRPQARDADRDGGQRRQPQLGARRPRATPPVAITRHRAQYGIGRGCRQRVPLPRTVRHAAVRLRQAAPGRDQSRQDSR